MRGRIFALFVVLVVLLAAPGAASAEDAVGPNPLQAADLSKYGYDPAKDVGAVVGKRFLEDVRAVDPRLYAAAVDAVRYEIQADEAAKFVRQRKYVIAAYAVLFVILVGFVAALWARSRKLQAELDALEARIRKSAAA